ncbi:MAG: S49 family peptidase [Prevotellaceae bacterium]|jgi:protease-4|nr:S49 family peptidase [Prevotellaceae bacterium]
MLRYKFIEAVDTKQMLISSSGQKVLNDILFSIYEGNFVPVLREDTDVIVSSLGQRVAIDNSQNQNPFDVWQENSIAIIPLSGVMFKESFWWSYGVDDIASIIECAYQSQKISAVILKINSPGGAVESLYKIQEVLSNKLKPTYAFIDGSCCSCAYITASYCDKIYAINRMSQVGSIGIMSKIIIPNKENSEFEIIETYPDESKDKNLTVRNAIDGKPELLKEELSKFAQYVIDIVKANRPKISEDALTGKDYFAYEALEKGMIDGIKPLSEVIAEIDVINSQRSKLITML